MEVMKIFVIITVYFILCCDYGQCILPVIMIGSVLAGITTYMLECSFRECCTDKYIPANFTLLNSLLTKNLYGQHLVHDTVLHAVRSHMNTAQPKKALAMSFHGLPGTGKNYVAEFIVKALYKEGDKSAYAHHYNGRIHFRSQGLVDQYRTELQKSIHTHLKDCPRSIFIFDEVEKIPKGTLDALVPYLDYHPKFRDIDPTQAIFIFLSNTGGTQIAKYLLEMWENGKSRKDAKLQDLEYMLAVTAFSEKGGFHKNDAIESSLIDHYVPFLPLEISHVRRCVLDAFRRRNVEPNNNQIKEAMTHLTFEPHPHNLYSTGGCKRLDQKVGNIISGHLYD